MIQYNKCYQSLKKVNGEWHAGHEEWTYLWNYMKFYPDGSVIFCSSIDQDLKKINSWFKKAKEGVFLYTGEFKIKKKILVWIWIPVSVGNLEMDGGIEKNSLILRIANKRVKQNYYWDEYTCAD